MEETDMGCVKEREARSRRRKGVERTATLGFCWGIREIQLS